MDEWLQRQEFVDDIADGAYKGLKKYHNDGGGGLINFLLGKYSKRQSNWADVIMDNSVLCHPVISREVDLDYWRTHLELRHHSFFGDEHEELALEVARVNKTFADRGYDVVSLTKELPFVKSTRVALMVSLKNDSTLGPGKRTVKDLAAARQAIGGLPAQVSVIFRERVNEQIEMETLRICPLGTKYDSDVITVNIALYDKWSFETICFANANSFLGPEKSEGIVAANGLSLHLVDAVDLTAQQKRQALSRLANSLEAKYVNFNDIEQMACSVAPAI